MDIYTHAPLSVSKNADMFRLPKQNRTTIEPNKNIVCQFVNYCSAIYLARLTTIYYKFQLIVLL